MHKFCYSVEFVLDPEGLICQALLSGNTEIAVELCMDAGRTSDALVIASTGRLKNTWYTFYSWIVFM